MSKPIIPNPIGPISDTSMIQYLSRRIDAMSQSVQIEVSVESLHTDKYPHGLGRLPGVARVISGYSEFQLSWDDKFVYVYNPSASTQTGTIEVS